MTGGADGVIFQRRALDVIDGNHAPAFARDGHVEIGGFQVRDGETGLVDHLHVDRDDVDAGPEGRNSGLILGRLRAQPTGAEQAQGGQQGHRPSITS